MLNDETTQLADGHYFLRIEQGGTSATKKVLLLRGGGH
ncbi:MAG: T9SS type A sorting domain-containing protein [Candidatus Eisenbacteria bacterium]|nr:T9SS type A sorting domain-containing protein [Candidatus Eisenbacteria bacterium]